MERDTVSAEDQTRKGSSPTRLVSSKFGSPNINRDGSTVSELQGLTSSEKDLRSGLRTTWREEANFGGISTKGCQIWKGWTRKERSGR